MIIAQIILYGLIYLVLTDGYIFLVMIGTSPRVWGYNDYSEEIKKKVPAQSKYEKVMGIILGIPWFIFIIAFPIYSTYLLKINYNNEFSIWIAIVNVILMVLLVNIVDVVVFDYLIVNKMTLKFVMIPGTTKEDYKDFSHHYKGHIKSIIFQIIFCIIISALVFFVL